MPSVRTYRVNNHDGQLYSWSHLNNEDFQWQSILIGNGASVNVWDTFSYRSIYTYATTRACTNRMTPADIKLFNSLNTHNFEQVLSSLNIAKTINQALGLGHTKITQRYDSIKQSLISTI